MNPIWFVFLAGLALGVFGQWIAAILYLNPWLVIVIVLTMVLMNLKGERV